MKYIISGGGTGGHIYPALSILKEIEKQDLDAEILYIGTENSLEEKLVKKAGYDFKAVTVKGMPRRPNIESIKSGVALLKGLIESRKIIKDFKPDAVIGTGGYVSFPIVFIAQRYGINTYIQEQNAFPGKANRWLAKGAKGVFIAFDDAIGRLENDRIINYGNPINIQYNHLDYNETREIMELKNEDKLVVSFGGSGGQESINEAVLELMSDPGDLEFKLIHITGTDHYDDFLQEIKDRGLIIGENIEILDYSHNMPILLSSADLVIMSSSAISLAEIEALGKRAILIPKSYTADNHQVYNAKSYEREHTSLTILEEDLSGEVVKTSIKSLLNTNTIERKSLNKAAENIAYTIIEDLKD